LITFLPHFVFPLVYSGKPSHNLFAGNLGATSRKACDKKPPPLGSGGLVQLSRLFFSLRANPPFNPSEGPPALSTIPNTTFSRAPGRTVRARNRFGDRLVSCFVSAGPPVLFTLFFLLLLLYPDVLSFLGLVDMPPKPHRPPSVIPTTYFYSPTTILLTISFLIPPFFVPFSIPFYICFHPTDPFLFFPDPLGLGVAFFSVFPPRSALVGSLLSCDPSYVTHNAGLYDSSFFSNIFNFRAKGPRPRHQTLHYTAQRPPKNFFPPCFPPPVGGGSLPASTCFRFNVFPQYQNPWNEPSLLHLQPFPLVTSFGGGKHHRPVPLWRSSCFVLSRRVPPSHHV